MKRVAAKMHKMKQKKQNKNKYRLKIIFGLSLLSVLCLLIWNNFDSPQTVSAEDLAAAFENALYTKQEFFGASALVPLPTRTARKNLAVIAENQADNPAVNEKLAELDEKLSDFDAAEKLLVRLAENDGAKLEKLAEFYERRAQFEKEAEVLRRILNTTVPENRGAALRKLINLARMHDLKNYLQSDFYAEAAKENPDVEEIFEQLADNLTEEKNYAEALNFVRQAKAQFPKKRTVWLAKEVEILLETGDDKAAETVYQQSFDPLWSNDEADKFYDFLNAHNRLRAYGAEMKLKFTKNPADFDAGIRYALYRNHDYSYGNDEITPIVLKIERSKKDWTTDELVTVSRLLLRANEPETASRFLYTLYLREDFKKNGELRAKVLYQLFEMFSDAETQKLPLTNGDLWFYEDVAKTDTNPGIATGILSLIFSDTHPREKLEAQEIEANEYFNRAAAYRIFLEYKQEFPVSRELAQMYLDIVRLYTATKEPEIAHAALTEFEQRFQNSSDYAAVALKLADAFAAVNQPEKTRAIYRKILDYQAGQNQPLTAKIVKKNQTADSGEIETPPNPNDGINIPKSNVKPPINEYEDAATGDFHDYLDGKNAPVFYADVLEKLVASLAAEKKTAEILELYSVEIKKHPDAQWLYEQRLTWLEQTNLTDEQLKLYQAALGRFQSRGWQDKLARWFLREKRAAEFADFSADLVGKLNDAETQDYLSQFVDGRISSEDFGKQFYFKLYATAHERFPHNPVFVQGILRYYKTNKMEKERRTFAAENYFEFAVVRDQFLDDLAEKNELRGFLTKADGETEIYQLFRADAETRLSNYENAVAAYRVLNEIYPNSAEYSEKLIALTRSFGQKNRETLTESATLATENADYLPSSAELRTRSGEIYAELGDYAKSRQEWEKLIPIAAGEKENYLDAATVYWDYYQYDDALRTIKTLREKYADSTVYAFEAGAVYESKHDQPAAVAEYVKAAGSEENEDGERQKEQAQNRLKSLYNRANDKNRFVEMVSDAYSSESSRRKDASFLTLGYAKFLAETVGIGRAEIVLNRAVSHNVNRTFLESARNFYQSDDDKSGERIVLKRLAETAISPRQSIAYRLQLAESYETDKQPDEAKTVLNRLVAKYPMNFGVLTESSNFYYRLGDENESAAVLQNALPRSQGRFRRALAGKLADRLIKLNRLAAAQQILTKLHEEDRAETKIFDELANVDVRLNDAANLRKVFDETVAALKNSDVERRELDAQIAELRGRMIDAFTKLKDYDSAVRQHIEIINREPQNEELTENAVRYVERYGGAETLLGFYLKTSAEAFKNYRWNVVLARIYEARNDSENAVKNYSAAIVNQPEMPELYISLADLQVKNNDFDAALKNLDEVLRLTGDAPEYVKKKIEVLKRAGRFSEIAAEQTKLPPETKLNVTTDEFVEAKNAQNKTQARELYQAAFAKLLENPLDGEFKTTDLSGYVQSVREVETLDKINRDFWILRVKLVDKAEEINSTNAGEAGKRLAILDNALIEMIGGIAKMIAADDERFALHEDLKTRIAENPSTRSLVQNISRRAGFGDLEEIILRSKIEAKNSAAERQIDLRNLVVFYDERGAYQKTFDALELYGTDDLPLKANAARRVNNRAKELDALRLIYWKDGKPATSNDANVARYLEVTAAENREELRSLTQKSSVYQIQLINFLLGRGERELAHSAIENSNLPAAWKVSRHAETSLALAEFGDAAECYFCDALQFDTIGNLVAQNPDKKSFLINDDWFRLAREYGDWLGANPSKTAAPEKFTTAMTENQPRNADQQIKLGVYYLNKKDLNAADEHLRLAVELEPENKTAWTYFGAAKYLADKKDEARKSWAVVLSDETRIKDLPPLLQTLEKYGLAKQAREFASPVIVDYLKNANADGSPESQNTIREIARSFTDENEKSIYFRDILRQRPTDVSLAAMLVNENLIAKNRQAEFYETLLERDPKSTGEDYDYMNITRRVWTQEDAESIADQENGYKIVEPNNQRFAHCKNYLALLVELREDQKAQRLIAIIEKDLTNRYALPPEIRLAQIRLKIRAGQFDAAQIERYVGISVSDSATEIHPPSVERFNDILQILKKENREKESGDISEAFFARMLALGQTDAANLGGFARLYFERGATDQGLQILRLAVDLNDESKRQTALAEIAAVEVVKNKTADAAKLANDAVNDSLDKSKMLKIAAETAAEFGQSTAAIDFRRQLAALNPADSANRIELAKRLAAAGEKAEAFNLLTQIVNDRDSLRTTRARARTILFENGENVEANESVFDAFGQFGDGLKERKNGRNDLAAEHLINSLTAEKDAEISARQQLIEVYAALNLNFAALNLAETDKTAKPDEMLQILSEAAEKVGDFSRAIEYEKSKMTVSGERISQLKQREIQSNRKATDFAVDLENTRKL